MLRRGGDFMTMMATWSFVGLAVVAFVTSCVADPPTPGEREEQLVVLLESPAHDMDPRFTIDAVSMRVSRLVFNNLVTVDNARAEAELELAVSITPDPASLDARGRPCRYIVRLRDDVRWHDGEPLTGRDVVYTYRSVLDPALGSPYRGGFARKIKDVRPVEGDPLAVMFELHRPYATFETDLVMGIVPAHILEKQQNGGRFDGDYVGTGPFRFVSRLEDRRLVLESNASHFAGAPPVRYLVFRTIRDESTRLLALVGGSADLALNSLSPVLLEVAGEQPGLVVESAPSLAWNYLAFNLRDPLVGDPKVRRAIALALDRETLVDRKLGGRAEISVGMMAPASWAHADDLEPLAPDRRRAEALLDEAGYPRDPETGVRFALSFKTSSDRFRRAVARAIGHQLETVGVHVELRSFEAGTFLSDIRKGNFQATLMKLPEPSEPDMLRWMFFSMNTPSELPERRDTIPGLQSLLEGEDKGCRLWAQREVLDSAWRVLDRLVGRPPPRDRANRTWYANPRFDCLVMRGWEELDRARRKPLYDEAQRLLAEDRPVINLWHEHNVVVRSERVRDFEILPNGRLTPLARCRLNN